ncbi:MAG: 2-succinyl-5-enolpyruvyl-6-hydroxy-3-cyclohexene- 1-carboxylate synthase [Oligoflexia bacterium]|nr:MAG: 2-succinyl-5-enolpyruvyl-6-hydroxy-3-cyclohexene- 1-carboxylate synthase [Oligoflexia bacterium]
MNIDLSEKVIRLLVQEGVSCFCICAGARNSPLVRVLSSAAGIRVLHFFDERSAAFFALGMIQANHNPVVVVTTSGTAVAELLPAAVEATYTSLPLVFLTADRPRAYRNTGAPQSIEQVGIFSHYVETTQDIESLDEEINLSQWTKSGPLHLNICFDEPLLDRAIEPLDCSKLVLNNRQFPQLVSEQKRLLNKPMVIVGPLKHKYRAQVVDFLKKLGAPIYAEVLSGLRGEPSLQNLLLQGGEKSVEKAFQENLTQSVLRVGGVPTLRFWRDLEVKLSHVPVYSISDNDYSGLSRRVSHLVGYHNLDLIQLKSVADKQELEKIFLQDTDIANRLQGLFQDYPKSEPSLVSRLAKMLQEKTIYIGNSLPIREWDLASHTSIHYKQVFGNRGANGIDGQISTFLGMAYELHENQAWAVVGDLTAMYDLNSLWITQKNQFQKLRIVVVNNNGGMIFKNLFGREEFLNRHEVGFQHWAEMFGWGYVQWTDVHPNQNLPDHCIIELLPDEDSSNQFWKKYREI